MWIESHPLIRHLENEFKLNPHIRSYLFTTTYTRILRLNMLILHVCINELREKGILISMDRPYRYIKRAMEKHDISTKNIIFVDAITKLTGQRVGEGTVIFRSGTFCPRLLSDIFSRAFTSEERESILVNLDDMQFVLIDNISIMPIYNTMKKTKEVIEEFFNLLTKFTQMRGFLVVDKEKSSAIYECIKRYVKKEINLPPEAL